MNTASNDLTQTGVLLNHSRPTSNSKKNKGSAKSEESKSEEIKTESVSLGAFKEKKNQEAIDAPRQLDAFVIHSSEFSVNALSTDHRSHKAVEDHLDSFLKLAAGFASLVSANNLALPLILPLNKEKARQQIEADEQEIENLKRFVEKTEAIYKERLGLLGVALKSCLKETDELNSFERHLDKREAEALSYIENRSHLKTPDATMSPLPLEKPKKTILQEINSLMKAMDVLKEVAISYNEILKKQLDYPAYKEVNVSDLNHKTACHYYQTTTAYLKELEELIEKIKNKKEDKRLELEKKLKDLKTTKEGIVTKDKLQIRDDQIMTCKYELASLQKQWEQIALRQNEVKSALNELKKIYGIKDDAASSLPNRKIEVVKTRKIETLYDDKNLSGEETLQGLKLIRQLLGFKETIVTDYLVFRSTPHEKLQKEFYSRDKLRFEQLTTSVKEFKENKEAKIKTLQTHINQFQIEIQTLDIKWAEIDKQIKHTYTQLSARKSWDLQEENKTEQQLAPATTSITGLLSALIPSSFFSGVVTTKQPETTTDS